MWVIINENLVVDPEEVVRVRSVLVNGMQAQVTEIHQRNGTIDIVDDMNVLDVLRKLSPMYVRECDE